MLLRRHKRENAEAGGGTMYTATVLVDENEIPEGALETHEDGSAKTYDENGNLTGTVDAETVARVQEEAGKHFTRTEISRMPVAELKEYAAAIGIEVTEESTGAKLKEQIIEKLGL